MTRQKKIYIGLAGFTGFLLISLLVIHYQASTFVNSEGMRKKVQTIISQKTGGKVEYLTADLSLLPYTHAVIHQANISIPGKGKGTIKTLNIIPKLLPLFIGKFLIDEIKIESPDIEMVITRSPESSNEAKEPFNLDTFKDSITGVLSPLATELPEFHITIKDGGFNLIEGGETVFTLSNVQAEIGCLSKEIEIKINGTSKICEDISVNARFDQKDSRGRGKIELRHFQPQTLINRFLPDAAYRITKPIDKVIVNLKTDGPNDLQVDIDKINVSGDYNHLSVNGDVNISENGLLFDLDMSANRLDWDTISEILDIGGKERAESAGKEKRFWDIPVKGILRLDAESFTFDQYTWNSVQADISFNPDYISVQVDDASLCGVSCPGVLKVTPQDISLDFQLLSHNQELGTTIECFGDKKGLVTGMFDLEAQIMARGTSEELGKSLHGNFQGIAKNGKYNKFGLLSKILSFLNPTETFRGKLLGLAKKGFPYKSITVNGQIQNGILMIDEYVLDAPSMGVTIHGTYDLTEKKVDLKVLVSPFNTADFVVKKTPIIRGLLGGTFVSIPVKVKGNIENPKISYLSPSAVGKKLLNTTKRVLKTPTGMLRKTKNIKEESDTKNED